jgi:hypothetical protein
VRRAAGAPERGPGGAAAVFELNHTGIKEMVPMIAATHFPDDPEKALDWHKICLLFRR